MVPTLNVPTTCELHQLIILVSKQSQCLLPHQQIVTMCEKTKKHVVCANANCSNVRKHQHSHTLLDTTKGFGKLIVQRYTPYVTLIHPR